MKLAISAPVVSGLLLATVVRATSTIVPDSYATIQAAIDANVDTVYVKGGTYNETVNITHGVFLSYYLGVYVPSVPIVTRLTSPPNVPGKITVRGFHLLRGATVSSVADCEVTLCRSDSGLACFSGHIARVTGCIVFGSLHTSSGGFTTQLMFNTVIGGTISSSAAGSSPISNNFVTGPAPVGIDVGEDHYATDNVVQGCTDGIVTGSSGSSAISGNIVQDCSGRGIVSTNRLSSMFCISNTVRRCADVGIDITGGGNPAIYSNRVDSTGSVGLRLTGWADLVSGNVITRAAGGGIAATGFVSRVQGNTVLHCGGDGIRTEFSNVLDHNVVGHNSGAGIRVTSSAGGPRLRSNTAFGNAGPGYSLQTSAEAPDSVANNIGFANSVGLERLGSGVVTLACNDWFANTGGATAGVAVGATDFALDPLFCNLPADVVTLAAGSPALNASGCGLVGALGQGCATPSAVGAIGETRSLSLRAYPQPNHGVVRFAWRPVTEPVRLEVYDAQGALRLTRDVSASAQEYALRTDSGGRILPAGIYFARLHGTTGELGTCRVVVLN